LSEEERREVSIKEEECHTSEKMIQVKIHSGTQQSTRVAALL